MPADKSIASSSFAHSVLILMTSTSMLSGTGVLSGLTGSGGNAGASCDPSDKACFASKVGWLRAELPGAAGGRLHWPACSRHAHQPLSGPTTLLSLHSHRTAAVGRHHHASGVTFYGLRPVPIPPAHASGRLYARHAYIFWCCDRHLVLETRQGMYNRKLATSESLNCFALQDLQQCAGSPVVAQRRLCGARQRAMVSPSARKGIHWPAPQPGLLK